MLLSTSTKGKRRDSPMTDTDTSLTKRSASSLSPQSSDSEASSPAAAPKTKRPKRAETRKCPVCDESIPLRLLSKHVLLEGERVNDIIQHIGSSESVESFDDFQLPEIYVTSPGPGTRRSALRARKFLRSHANDTVDQAAKVIQTIKRHRKQRHTRLRDLTRDLDDEATTASGSGSSRDAFGRRLNNEQIECPVCMKAIHGDEDVLGAHIDSCLADQARQAEVETTEDAEVVGHVGDVMGTWEQPIRLTGRIKPRIFGKGTGFHTRNPNDRDVEEDVDIDGDDQAVYGEVQFTEGDVITLTQGRRSDTSNGFDEDEDVEIDAETDDEMDVEDKSLHDLVAEGKAIRRATKGDGVDAVRAKMNEVMGIGDTDRLDLAIAAARTGGDRVAMITALESKIKLTESMRVASATSLLCRICLDPYTEPTVSTGCWHTCCRECWLRCLGSTKLCPICKRITGATDLRRIYL